MCYLTRRHLFSQIEGSSEINCKPNAEQNLFSYAEAQL